jgi:hypothetical protein
MKTSIQVGAVSHLGEGTESVSPNNNEIRSSSMKLVIGMIILPIVAILGGCSSEPQIKAVQAEQVTDGQLSCDQLKAEILSTETTMAKIDEDMSDSDTQVATIAAVSMLRGLAAPGSADAYRASTESSQMQTVNETSKYKSNTVKDSYQARRDALMYRFNENGCGEQSF